MRLPIAELSTAIWMLYAVLLIGQKLFGSLTSVDFHKRFALGWFLYCVPIHLHGVIPLLRAKEMTEMDRHPDMYFGAYPHYCEADPRYCSNDMFIRMIQGGTAVFITPLCFLAFLAYLKNSPLRYANALVVSAMQLFGTILFFVEPFVLEKNPIPTVGFNFWFEFLFMNNLWIWIPVYFISCSLKQTHDSQKVFDRAFDAVVKGFKKNRTEQKEQVAEIEPEKENKED